jgi:pyruvate dehydrogenase E1 component alpha subunit
MSTDLTAGTDAGAAAPDRAELDRDLRLRLYRTMLECRLFEQRTHELFLAGLVRGTTHLGIGQEAVAAGFAAAMQPGDWTFCTYRGHNHTLARGVPMTPVLLELVGKQGALMGGKGGSMHLTSVEHGAMGSYAIVGAHLPIAVGAAWSAQYRRSGQVAVCFFGDGTTNIGSFHEALNMAVVWKAPVVFVCENNQYMEYTPIRSVTAVDRPAADRAAAYGLEDLVVDGNDVEAVHAMARATIERARAGEGPSLVEAVTYRHGGHSRADPGTYRPEEEVRAWLARDPIPAQRARLLKSGVEEEVLARIEAEVKAAVADAEKVAREAPEPDPAVATTQVWADGGSSWRS